MKYILKKINNINIFFLSLIIRIKLRCIGIKIKNIKVLGFPIIEVRKNGKLSLGENITMINNQKHSTLGKVNKCKLLVYSNAELKIGNKIGMSNVTIIATKSIIIGNNVMIGGGVTIIDSDFHSMDSSLWFSEKDELNMKSAQVNIGDNVFIGMNTIILKGVNIGNNVKIAAGSIITKNIDDNQTWGGNPAKKLNIQ